MLIKSCTVHACLDVLTGDPQAHRELQFQTSSSMIDRIEAYSRAKLLQHIHSRETAGPRHDVSHPAALLLLLLKLVTGFQIEYTPSHSDSDVNWSRAWTVLFLGKNSSISTNSRSQIVWGSLEVTVGRPGGARSSVGVDGLASQTVRHPPSSTAQ